MGCLLSLGLIACTTEDFIIPPVPESETITPAEPGESPTPESPTGCPGQENAVVNVNRLNVREKPSRDATVLRVILHREQYQVLNYSADGQWVQLHLVPGDQTGWVYEPLVNVICTAGRLEQVVLNNLAHRWSQGEILTGTGYVKQATSLYAQPGLDSRVVGSASPDRLLVIQDVVQDATGVRWALVWSAEEQGELWILADRVIPLSTTLAGLYEADTIWLGARAQVGLYEQALRRFVVLPPSDGGRVYDRSDYFMPSSVAATECDAVCAFLQDHQHGSGGWYLPYEDRFTLDATEVVAEPLVPFYEVHVSEGWLWNESQRQRYVLERAGKGTWVVMSREMRQQRGALDPGDWLPVIHVARCRYAADWITVKEQWQLVMDEREKQVLADILSLCDDQHLAVTTTHPFPAPGPGQVDAAVPLADSPPARLHLHCDARKEIVTITNPGTSVENLNGWHMHDANNLNRFTLPRWMLNAGASVTVTSGEAAGDIHLTDAFIWNNNGDTVYLYDALYQLVAVQDCE